MIKLFVDSRLTAPGRGLGRGWCRVMPGVTAWLAGCLLMLSTSGCASRWEAPELSNLASPPDFVLAFTVEGPTVGDDPRLLSSQYRVEPDGALRVALGRSNELRAADHWMHRLRPSERDGLIALVEELGLVRQADAQARGQAPSEAPAAANYAGAPRWTERQGIVVVGGRSQAAPVPVRYHMEMAAWGRTYALSGSPLDQPDLLTLLDRLITLARGQPLQQDLPEALQPRRRPVEREAPDLPDGSSPGASPTHDR